MAGTGSPYGRENSIQFGKSCNADAGIIADYISRRIEECKSGMEHAVTPPAISSADEIVKFKNLYDQGIITEEEFNAKKKQLLGL